jgi:uncharacterized protein (DUF433 family)
VTTNLDRPTYSPTLAGRLVDLSPDRVRRWLLGYSYSYPVSTGELRTSQKAPVVHRKGARGSQYASFLDLIDLLFVKKFLDHGISLQRLRQALDETQKIIGGHHFAQRGFFTDGKKIYLEVKHSKQSADALLELLSGGQWVIAPVIKQAAHQIEFDDETGFAERWYPLGQDKPIVIDPAIAFGAPTLVGRGIKTSNVHDLFLAEEKQVNRVCSWMSLTESEVRTAVAFESQLLAA